MSADVDFIKDAAIAGADAQAIRDLLEDAALSDEEIPGAVWLFICLTVLNSGTSAEDLTARWADFRDAVRARHGLAAGTRDVEEFYDVAEIGHPAVEAAIQLKCAEIDDAYRALCEGEAL